MMCVCVCVCEREREGVTGRKRQIRACVEIVLADSILDARSQHLRRVRKTAKSGCPFVCPFVRMELDSHWKDFNEI